MAKKCSERQAEKDKEKMRECLKQDNSEAYYGVGQAA